ncbi:MAG: ABC transporter permease [Bacillota bacterium]
MKAIRALWAIFRKDMQNYYLKPPNISWGIVFPISWTLMFFLRSRGAPLDVKDLLPGVMAMSVLFGTTSMLAVTITFEKRSRSFDRLLLAPIDLNLLMFAKTSGAIAFGTVNSLVPVVLAAFWADLSGTNWLAAIPAILLIAASSTFLGLLIAVSVKEVFEAQTFSNFFRFPMIFLCGLFLPLTDIPVVIRPLSYALPLTYGNDLLRHAFLGAGSLNPLISWLALAGFTAGLFGMSIRNARRSWIS